MTKAKKQKVPKMVYKFVDSKEGQEKLDKAFDILFTEMSQKENEAKK